MSGPRARVLEHLGRPLDRRERLYDAIQRHPGIHKGALQRMTGESWGNLTHHIFMLSRRRRIRCQYVGNRLALFPNEIPEHDLAPLAALRRPLAQHVVRVLIDESGLRLHAISRRVRVPRKTVARVLEALHDAGVIHRGGVRPAEYSLARDVDSLLAYCEQRTNCHEGQTSANLGRPLGPILST